MEGSGRIAPEHWIPHPVSDHGDMDRPEPAYAKDLTGEDRAAYEADEKAGAPAKKRRRRRKPKQP